MKFVDSNYILDELYPLVKSKLDNKNIERKFISNIAQFFNTKSTQINDIAPYTNIYFNQSDLDKLFKSIDITEKEVIDILSKCWFWDQDIRPKCTKEPYVEVLMCAIRYYIISNNIKYTEMITIYLLFSGKFYASIYSSLWRFPANPSIMDYVINNNLSDKYDLKKEGTVFKAIKKLANTYLDKYSKDIASRDHSDNDFKNNIQQLRDREKSFLGNIFTSYMEAAESKSYLNYETDNLDPDKFRITDNDSAKASRITESAIGILTTQKVSREYCNNAHDSRVKSEQVQSILENIILSDKNNIPQLKRVINIMICDFMSGNPGVPVNSAAFLSYAITAKPNTKNDLVIEMKTTILSWLEQDAVYRKRSATKATAISYYRSIVCYLAQVIMKAAGRN